MASIPTRLTLPSRLYIPFSMGYRKSDDIDRNHGLSVTAPPTRTKSVLLRIDEELYNRLRQAAAQESRTLSAFLRAAALHRADATLMLNPRVPPGPPR